MIAPAHRRSPATPRPFLLSVLALGPLVGSPGEGSRVEADAYLAHVRFLARDELEGRGSGTVGQKAASIYVANAFRRAGLEAAGDEGSPFQRFDVAVPGLVAPGPGSRLALRSNGAERVLACPEDFVPLGVSGRGGAEGDLVFAGYAIRAPELGYDDFEGLDLRGKVALAMRHSPGESRPESAFGEVASRLGRFSEKARLAAEAGAVALVVVNDPLAHEEDELVALGRGGGEESASIPVVQAKRAPFEEVLRALDSDLAALQADIDERLRPRSFALPGVRVEVFADLAVEGGGRLSTENVVGRLPGADPSLASEVVVVGAHYDHVGRGAYGARVAGEIHNGADDNASGTAGLLEIARLLASGPRPRRTVLLVAFSGEELGLLGSRHFVEDPPVALEGIVAMVNLDMIGRSREGRCQVGGLGTSPVWSDLVRAANEGVGLELSLDPAVMAGSDHASFSRRKIPVLFLFTGFHEDYHRPTDDWEKVNAADGARIATLAARVVERVANAAERPSWTEPPRGTRRARPSTREARPAGGPPYLGVEIEETEDGLRVVGVEEGGPAAQAGVSVGDALLEIEGTPVRTLDALRAALSEWRSGETIRLRTARDLEVRLGTRPR